MSITDSERLARVERKIDLIPRAVDENTETVRITNAMVGELNVMVGELMEWLKTPPSHELSDALKALVATVTEVRDSIVGLRNDVARVLTAYAKDSTRS